MTHKQGRLVNAFQASVALKQGRTVRGYMDGMPDSSPAYGVSVGYIKDDLGYLLLERGTSVLFRTEGCLLMSGVNPTFVVYDELPVAPREPSSPNRRFTDSGWLYDSGLWDARYLAFEKRLEREHPCTVENGYDQPPLHKQAYLAALDNVTLYGTLGALNAEVVCCGGEPYRNLSRLAYAILVEELREEVAA